MIEMLMQMLTYIQGSPQIWKKNFTNISSWSSASKASIKPQNKFSNASLDLLSKVSEDLNKFSNKCIYC